MLLCLAAKGRSAHDLCPVELVDSEQKTTATSAVDLVHNRKKHARKEPTSMAEEKIIGIDLGTTNSVVAVMEGS